MASAIWTNFSLHAPPAALAEWVTVGQPGVHSALSPSSVLARHSNGRHHVETAASGTLEVGRELKLGPPYQAMLVASNLPSEDCHPASTLQLGCSTGPGSLAAGAVTSITAPDAGGLSPTVEQEADQQDASHLPGPLESRQVLAAVAYTAEHAFMLSHLGACGDGPRQLQAPSLLVGLVEPTHLPDGTGV